MNKSSKPDQLTIRKFFGRAAENAPMSEKILMEQYHSPLTLLDNEISCSLACGAYFVAVIGMTTKIDILSKIHAGETTENKGATGERFKKFCLDYDIKSQSDEITERCIWGLRCSLVHSFNLENDIGKKAPVKYILSRTGKLFRKIDTHTIAINITELCARIKRAENGLYTTLIAEGVTTRQLHVIRSFGEIHIGNVSGIADASGPIS